jgi:hypothetical protein
VKVMHRFSLVVQCCDKVSNPFSEESVASKR